METHRREFLMGLAAAGANAQTAGRTPRPNILFLHSHDTGRYTLPYGHHVPTPNLLKLAQGGVLFRNAFDAAPTCSPSRAALLTGQCPHVCGMFGLVNFGFSMEHYQRHILRTLKPAGYHTAAVGIQHIVKDPRWLGYDEILARDEHLEAGAAKIVAPQAVGFLRRPPKQPFFLAAGFFETHRPFAAATLADDPRYTLPPAPIADSPQNRRDMADFRATARNLDNAIGEILTALEQSGLADNTLVIYTTDHGPAFPEMKCSLRDAGTGVSLILRGPREFQGGKTCDAMVSHLDLFPTICDFAGIQPPDWLQGRSMMPLVRGEKDEINDEIHAEVNYHIAYEPKRSVRTQRYKHIRHLLKRDHPVIANCDASLSKDFFLAHGWHDELVDHEELYDLALDPHEARNLMNDPAHAKLAQDMRGRLDRWMRQTQDPVLVARIKAPSGARVWDPDGAFPGPRFVTIP